MDPTASLRVLYPTTTGAGFLVRETASPAPNQPRLLDRVRAAIRACHYSRRTEKAYVGWIRRFIHFHHRRHPTEMGGAEVTQFLSALVVDRNVAASTQNQALSAILFLYRDVLEQDLPWLDDIVRSKRAARLPVVLTREEIRAVLQRMSGVPRLMAILLYGAGLRLLECARLRVKDVDFARNQITVRAGKGDKDRVTMLPAAVKDALAKHLEIVKSSTSSTWHTAPAGWSSRGPWRASTRTPAASGPGSGSSRRLGSTSTRVPNSTAATISTSRSCRVRSGCREARRDHQARKLAHLSPLLRDAPARGAPRYPHRPKAPGTP